MSIPKTLNVTLNILTEEQEYCWDRIGRPWRKQFSWGLWPWMLDLLKGRENLGYERLKGIHCFTLFLTA